MLDEPIARSDMPAIAAVRADAGESVDPVLAEIAAALRPCGLRIGGIVQEEHQDSGAARPGTRLRDLSDGMLIQISWDRGRHARGCRLDPGALAEAARRLEDTVEAGVDLLILNRFGKSESEGAGLRTIIERAMLAGVPVLTAVRNEYAAAWDDFHGGMAVWLPIDTNAVLAWCCAVTGLGRMPARIFDMSAS
ncbi:DUF2478 domain-containing protein [Phyllobacterium phragmitis]|uniref:DUF2478 domain-containing protein n=1 Tax=Phyllobacterium phragmitis TaxID=2670329 RepID=A0ABQ0H672_9HYPH